MPRAALRSSIRLSLVCAAVAGLTAAGCGKKGPPQAPLGIRPESPRALQARQRGETIWISLREPAKRTDGSELDPGAYLRIFMLPEGLPKPSRAGRSGLPPPPTRPSGAPAWILEREKWPGYRAGSRLEVPLSLSSLGLRAAGGASLDGRRIAFAAEVQEGRRHRSELAGPVPLTLCEAPAPPASVQAEMTESGIRIRWDPPKSIEAKANLYRADGKSPPSGEPYASVVASEGVFIDRKLEPGATYSYELRFARGEGGSSCESTAAAAAARSIDTFPPAPPKGVAAVAEEALIRLFWSPSPETDLAGYIVYRREGEGGEWRRMNETLLTDTTWADTTVLPGVEYTYVVTAMDGAATPNESGRSEPVSEKIR